MLGGTGAIWTAILSAVAFAVRVHAPSMRAEGFEPPSS